MSARVPHWIVPLKRTSIPVRHVVLDSEAVSAPTIDGRQQTFRLAVAAYVNREDRTDLPPRWSRYTDPAGLWGEISAFCRAKRRTVAWAHNLAYDLRTTQALQLLPELGWQVRAVSFEGRTAWVRLQHGGRSLVLADSQAVFPCALADLGRDLGLVKHPLPRAGSSTELWFRRCERDVDILLRALTEYLAWIEREDLGSWQLTGAGQAFAAWRRRFYTHRVAVHADPDALAAERRASWAGRCEAFYVGAEPRRTAYEFDLEGAYPRIAQTHDLPVALRGPVHLRDWDDYDQRRRQGNILARVEVATEVPAVPTLHQGRIVWPTGRFTTWLWDPEIDLLREQLAAVRFGAAWFYSSAPALRAWADWILQQLAAPASKIPPHIRRAVKLWSRAGIGKFGVRYRGWEFFDNAPHDDARIHVWNDARTDETFDVLWLGHQLFRRGDLTEGMNSSPAVMGYVMSACRAQLWRIVTLIGEANVLYVDTDSVVVDAAGRREIERLHRHPLFKHLRRKRQGRGFEVWGPKRIAFGSTVRIAGVPRKAQRTGPDTFAGEEWTTLETSLRWGMADRVLLRDRTFTLRREDGRRVLGPGGRTRALLLGEGDHDDAHPELVAGGENSAV